MREITVRLDDKEHLLAVLVNGKEAFNVDGPIDRIHESASVELSASTDCKGLSYKFRITRDL